MKSICSYQRLYIFHLILLKIESKSFFMSNNILVWPFSWLFKFRNLAADKSLNFPNLAFVFSKFASLSNSNRNIRDYSNSVKIWHSSSQSLRTYQTVIGISKITTMVLIFNMWKTTYTRKKKPGSYFSITTCLCHCIENIKLQAKIRQNFVHQIFSVLMYNEHPTDNSCPTAVKKSHTFT